MTNIHEPLPKGARVLVVTQGVSTPSGMLMNSGTRASTGRLRWALNPAHPHATVCYASDEDAALNIFSEVNFRRAAAAEAPYGVWAIDENGEIL